VHIEFSCRDSRERGHLEDLGVEESIVLKCNVKNIMGEDVVWSDWA
jgi:hypothetical protein